MAKSSDAAKQIAINDILNMYEGRSALIDKKLYVNYHLDDEEVVQLCFSLTAPKTPMEINDSYSFGKQGESAEDIEKKVEQYLDILGLNT